MTDDKPIASEGERVLIEYQIERLEVVLTEKRLARDSERKSPAGELDLFDEWWVKELAPLQTELWKLRAQVHDYYLRDAYPVEDEEVKGSWSADVFSMRDLIAAAAQNPEEYAQYLKPNDVALNKRARTDKAAFHVPGVAAIRKEKESK